MVQSKGTIAMPRQHAGVSVLAVVVSLALQACAHRGTGEPVEASGRIEGYEVRIASKIPGRVVKRLVGEGDRVEAGQLVAELDVRELEARRRQALADARAAQAEVEALEARVGLLEHHAQTARTDHERSQRLLASGAIAERAFDQSANALAEAEGDLATTRARLARARAVRQEREAGAEVVATQLEDCRIRSPLAGTVLHRLVEEGEVVQAGQPLVVMVNPDSLFLRAYVAETDIGGVQIGSRARVTVDGMPERTFQGVVDEIAEKAEFTPRDVHMPDERARLVYPVKIRLSNPERMLKPGMLADVSIPVGSSAAGRGG